ncbi:MAG TPA: SEC59/DGK1/VTE5 family protein [Candidatus Kapabacteria bacterium]|nr:SEC59/DGK1/VTE5 family protein [Candidatus Kapabacteria bacterium]
MSGELARKMIHLSSLAIPVAYSFLPKSTILWVLLPMTAIAVIIDYGKFYIGGVDRFYKFLFGPILREHETDGTRKLLSGGSYVLISACLCIIIFPKVIAITAFAVLIVSDATSALIGRRFGKHAFFDKSLEGSIAFFVSALLVISLAPKAAGSITEFFVAAFGALVGTIAEAMSTRLKLDDNFSVPCTIGITMWIVYFLLSLTHDPSYVSLYRQLMQQP